MFEESPGKTELPLIQTGVPQMDQHTASQPTGGGAGKWKKFGGFHNRSRRVAPAP